jgi:5-methylcytosine-specific restriction endonuclease McrA
VKYNSQDRQAISDIKILEATKDAFSAANVLKKLDLNYNSINLNWLKKKTILLNIENSWFGSGNRKGKKLPWFSKKETMDNILNNTIPCSSSKLKEKLYSAGLLKPICSNCNLSLWLNKPISLQIDHINGNSKDNRLENLRILCPNCHS